ncbi:ketopantoate reductase [Salinihabitans flavidus]|uniref:2-dehydropantoate 2-reductase n=1 Tax=Salinihabitans flavidus TaxID=569882 RepID=A0A1H8RFS1_9RHOB|nr:2-dehydropantoate 2-reductase [Salinihabitans flavidus]SEO65182.1 ketopantoate reductase [Salinihabitans flavidus]
MAARKAQHRQEDVFPRIVIAGAGRVGCFVGGLLAHGGHHVTLLLRERMREAISRNGLRVSDFTGLELELNSDLFGMATDPAALAEADVILVTVKSGDTAAMAEQIARHAHKDAVVISLQNGVGNPGVLREALPGRDVRAGMVPFNVVSRGDGLFHRASSGDIVIGNGRRNWARALSVPGLHMRQRRKMAPLQWGKLLFNLNTSLNALSGVPLREQIARMTWRRLMADQTAEAISVLKAAGIPVRLPVPLPVRLLPIVLRLPTFLFRHVARPLLTIDPYARGSMVEDLERGRPTEIDELQEMIVELARQQGQRAPINARVAALIREAEAKGSGPPQLSPREVRG